MKDFGSYVSEQAIIRTLSRARVKVAQARNRKHKILQLTACAEFDYHAEVLRASGNELECMMPPRRKWKKLGKSRRRAARGGVLNSISKNIKSLELTINDALRNGSTEPFAERLRTFLARVQNAVSDIHFGLSWPKVRPEPKDRKDGVTICRPLARYSVLDGVLIGATNKYLTEFLDAEFVSNSFAFRSRKVVGTRASIPNHHDAFQRIIDYRRAHDGTELYVAECDIKKFFDSVNHSDVKRAFAQAVRRAEGRHKQKCDRSAIRLFQSYLDSYTFCRNVLPLNSRQDHFKRFDIPRGRYDWVGKEMRERRYYRQPPRARIGIPQGGALSGLIANLVLHKADLAATRLDDGDLLYLRYCDDMIIGHPSEEVCRAALKAYQSAIVRLRLVPHDVVPAVEYGTEYWLHKSKGPYKWAPRDRGGIPWVGFVGYEISAEGHVRVRKKSLKKELEKQREVVEELLRALRSSGGRVSDRTIEESAIGRLVGMAVGRIELWNHLDREPEMCWTRGFHLVNDNPASRVQMKSLDRNRNMLMAKLRRELQFLPAGGLRTESKKRKRQLIYYGKPFSYFFQLIERRSRTTNDADGGVPQPQIR